MNLVKGIAEVFPKPGKSFDPDLIPKAIKDAGFTATEIVVTADVIPRKQGTSFEVGVAGLARPIVLEDGAQADALKKRADLIGKKVRVLGTFHPSQADRPPRLSLEKFEAVP